MATGTIILPIPGGTPPDGSTNNASAQLDRIKSSGAAPSPTFSQLLFDPSTDEHWFWTFRMPVNYASGPVAKLQWKANATSNSVVWCVSLAAITPADTDTPNEKASATTNTATTAVNSTEARRLVETSITLTNADSVAANDWVCVTVFRDANNGSDNCSVDAELVAVSIEYTTT